MNKIKSNPSKTILVIISGLLVFYFFYKSNIVLNIILLLCFIGVFSSYITMKIEFIWFKIAYILGLIIPNIVLGVIFYFFLFPIALLYRLSSKDLLHKKNKSNTIFKDVNKTFEKQSFEETF